MNEMNEIEEMRQQMNILREKLTKQEIINDTLIRSSISEKMNNIKKQRWLKRCIIIFGIIYCPWMIYKLLEMPIWFAIATIAIFVIAFIYEEVYSNGTTNNDDLSRHGLMETCEKVIRMKKMNKRWLWFGIPMAIIWVATFVYLIYHNGELAGAEQELLYGVGIGLGIGAILGAKVYLKGQRQATELIDNIHELKDEEME
ncbi:MAG: hypothetical protein J5682_08875 [Prevotella sp.]|nr:hypothetical protein [Prevotella sp.]